MDLSSCDLYIVATSALDNESEKIVQEALDRAAQGLSVSML